MAVARACRGRVSQNSRGGVSLMKTRMRLRAPWKLAKSDPAPPVDAEPTWSTTASGMTLQAPPASRIR